MTTNPPGTAALLPMEAPRARRRAGGALLAFGISGLALLAVAASLAVGSLGAVSDAATSIEGQRARLVALLEPAETALRGAAETATNAGTSLESSERAAHDAAGLTTQLAEAMDSMSRAAQVDVFGVRPFAPLAGELGDVAVRSRTLAGDLQATALALAVNAGDTRTSGDDLRLLADQLMALRTELAPGGWAGTAPVAGEATDAAAIIAVARAVLLGLLAWLAVPALAAIWLGWRWRRG